MSLNRSSRPHSLSRDYGFAQSQAVLVRQYASGTSVDRHPMHLVDIPGEGVYPRCQECGMQTNPRALAANNTTTDLCIGLQERNAQRNAAIIDSALSLRQVFTAYRDGEEL